MFAALRRGNVPEAIVRMLVWAAAMAVCATTASYLAPAEMSHLFIHGDAYRREMFEFVLTGRGAEGNIRQFLPQHALHAAAFCALAIASGSALAMPLGAVLMNYMSYYVGALGAASLQPIRTMALRLGAVGHHSHRQLRRPRRRPRRPRPRSAGTVRVPPARPASMDCARAVRAAARRRAEVGACAMVARADSSGGGMVERADCHGSRSATDLHGSTRMLAGGFRGIRASRGCRRTRTSGVLRSSAGLRPGRDVCRPAARSAARRTQSTTQVIPARLLHRMPGSVTTAQTTPTNPCESVKIRG
jgi:hypothetical protein